MIKKMYLTILGGCFCPVLFAQLRGEVVYERVLNFGEVSKSEFVLYFDHDRAAFIERSQPVGTSRVKQKGGQDETLEFSVRLAAEQPYGVFTDFVRGQLWSRIAGKQNKTVLVHENLEAIPWKIGLNEKRIGEMDCKQATAHFRGRSYTAWFSPQLTSGCGPWKFHGLPGLILEIYDSTGEVYFVASSVKVPSDFSSSLLSLQTQGQRVISLKEYFLERNEQLSEAISAIQSKLPRGSSVDFARHKVSAIETEYTLDE